MVRPILSEDGLVFTLTERTFYLSYKNSILKLHLRTSVCFTFTKKHQGTWLLLRYCHKLDVPDLSDFDHDHEGLLRIRPEELLPHLAYRLNTCHQIHSWRAMFYWCSTTLQGLELWEKQTMCNEGTLQMKSVKLQKTYLVYLHGPLHPLLGGTKYLVQPVRQGLSEALLKVCQLKNSPKITGNTRRIYSLSSTWSCVIIYFKVGVCLLTSSVRKPCLSGYSEGSGKQGTGCWPASVPCDLQSGTNFPSLPLPARWENAKKWVEWH